MISSAAPRPEIQAPCTVPRKSRLVVRGGAQAAVGLHAAAGPIPGLDHDNVDAFSNERMRGDEPGDARTDDDDVVLVVPIHRGRDATPPRRYTRT